jgi:hypothetical protein
VAAQPVAPQVVLSSIDLVGQFTTFLEQGMFKYELVIVTVFRMLFHNVTVMCCEVISDNNMIALQECMDLLTVVSGPGSEASVACSHIKVEEDIDVQEQKDPLLLPFPFIKLEQEVSCMSVHCHSHFTCVLLSVHLYM